MDAGKRYGVLERRMQANWSLLQTVEQVTMRSVALPSPTHRVIPVGGTAVREGQCGPVEGGQALLGSLNEVQKVHPPWLV